MLPDLRLPSLRALHRGLVRGDRVPLLGMQEVGREAGRQWCDPRVWAASSGTLESASSAAACASCTNAAAAAAAGAAAGEELRDNGSMKRWNRYPGGDWRAREICRLLYIVIIFIGGLNWRI